MRITSERRTFIRARALERFRHYVTIDTRSDPESQRHPSSEGQWDLARILRDELNAMEGLTVELDGHCYLYAHKAEVAFSGVNVHPGYAKNRMINAAAIAARFAAELPAHETPEHTAGREGFFHLTAIDGNESRARLHLILRDFDAERNRRRVVILEKLQALYRKLYPGLAVDLSVREQYRNMKEVLERHPEVLAVARRACEAAGVEVIDKAIRGGTDGARFCFMGMPTPNLFAGGLLFHSHKEWIPVRALQKSTEVILHLCRLWAQTPPAVPRPPAAAPEFDENEA